MVTPVTTRNEARYWSRIAIFAYPTCIRSSSWEGVPSEYCHKRLLWKNKNGVATQWWKKIEDMIISLLFSFDRIHEYDGHPDTARRHRPRLYIASRAKSFCCWNNPFWATVANTHIFHNAHNVCACSRTTKQAYRQCIELDEYGTLISPVVLATGCSAGLSAHSAHRPDIPGLTALLSRLKSPFTHSTWFNQDYIQKFQEEPGLYQNIFNYSILSKNGVIPIPSIWWRPVRRNAAIFNLSDFMNMA